MKIAVVNINSAFRDPQYVSVKIDGYCNHMDSEVISYGNRMRMDLYGHIEDHDREEICLSCRAWRPTEGDRWFNEDSNEEVV